VLVAVFQRSWLVVANMKFRVAPCILRGSWACRSWDCPGDVHCGAEVGVGVGLFEVEWGVQADRHGRAAWFFPPIFASAQPAPLCQAMLGW
jgi:hypothetical protein